MYDLGAVEPGETVVEPEDSVVKDLEKYND